MSHIKLQCVSWQIDEKLSHFMLGCKVLRDVDFSSSTAQSEAEADIFSSIQSWKWELIWLPTSCFLRPATVTHHHPPINPTEWIVCHLSSIQSHTWLSTAEPQRNWCLASWIHTSLLILPCRCVWQRKSERHRQWQITCLHLGLCLRDDNRSHLSVYMLLQMYIADHLCSDLIISADIWQSDCQQACRPAVLNLPLERPTSPACFHQNNHHVQHYWVFPCNVLQWSCNCALVFTLQQTASNLSDQITVHLCGHLFLYLPVSTCDPLTQRHILKSSVSVWTIRPLLPFTMHLTSSMTRDMFPKSCY